MRSAAKGAAGLWASRDRVLGQRFVASARAAARDDTQGPPDPARRRFHHLPGAARPRWSKQCFGTLRIRCNNMPLRSLSANVAIT